MNDSFAENPFTPTFGEVPLHLAGRAQLLNDLNRAFSGTRRHPYLTTAITGARGTGKTALLSAAASLAERNGWVSVRTVALPGMLDDILITARRVASHLVDDGSASKLSGIEVGNVMGLEWSHPDKLTNWRNEMTLLLEQLAQTGTGLLITVDEVQPELDEMIRLAAVYQLFVTEGRKVALMMAGLPNNILQLEKDKTVSFLRRAQKVKLGMIPDYEVENAMLRTIEEGGRSIDAEALAVAVREAEGFPFMMQLVGFRMWDQHPGERQIGMDDALAGAAMARAEMRKRIVETTYGSLSKGDKAFLAAMIPDAESSAVRDIAQRMGKSNSYATQYKNRLLGQGVIAATADGRLRFDLPMMREYVQEQQG